METGCSLLNDNDDNNDNKNNHHDNDKNDNDNSIVVKLLLYCNTRMETGCSPGRRAELGRGWSTRSFSETFGDWGLGFRVF